MSKYILEGEFDTLCNGLKSSVIVQIVFNTKEEAEKGKEERYTQYKKMKVKAYNETKHT